MAARSFLMLLGAFINFLCFFFLLFHLNESFGLAKIIIPLMLVGTACITVALLLKMRILRKIK